MSSRASASTTKTQTAAPKTVASPPTTPSKEACVVPHEKIAMRAYDKWCRRGQPCGTDQQDWQEAEAELKAEIAKAGKQTR